MTGRRFWLVLFTGFAVLFLTTGHWYGTVSVDTQAADLEAYQLVHTGSLDLSDVKGLPDNPFLIRTDGGVVTDRTAGVILVGVPMQAALAPFEPSPDTAGVATAALLVAAALASLATVMAELGGGRRRAAACTVALGLGSAVWTVASSELWTHSAAALWLVLLLRAAQRERWWWAGSFALLATVTRVHLLLIAVLLVVAVTIAERRLRPLLLVGAGVAAATALLVSWNAAVFGHPGLTGGYYRQYVGVRLQEHGLVSQELEGFAGTLISPLRGVLLYTPVAIVAALGVWRGWRSAPSWARGAAIGAVLYLGVQLKVNGFYGGTAFFGNRLVVEALLVGAPLAYCGYLRAGAGARHAARVLAAVSIAVHATGAVFAGAASNYQQTEGRGWRIWLLHDVLRETGVAGETVFGVALLTALACAYGLPGKLLCRMRHRLAL
ncbi:MAG: hypothetical protein JWO22_526 [Frankiales bacterium]|nr:hypothetical protein [Frankiales bacterium]